MVDAGFSGKRLRERLDDAGLSSDSLCGILVTHEHGDHVQGLRVFANKLNLPVYANALTAERLHHIKKRPDRMVLFNNGAPFTVGPFTIEPFTISHDAVDPVGFLVQVGGRRIAIATDFGHAGKMLPFKISNCDLLMVESN
jgi:phosphoribosyl 1,2-cyclic phosphodiesterase